MTTVYFNGEEGRIEGKYNQSTNPEPQVALILHSEPSKGGSMNDEVIDGMYKLFSNNNFSVLKMNFRGVGRSSGISTKEEGEILSYQYTVIGVPIFMVTWIFKLGNYEAE